MELTYFINNASVLVIDDELPILILTEAYLAPLCKEVIIEQNIETALVLAKTKQPDIILLDIRMQEIDGYEVCKCLKANNETAHIPVIFLTSLSNTEDKVKGFAVGGVDYICKPFAIDEMVARIESSLKLHQQIRQLQTQTKTTKNVQENIEHYHLTLREVEILTLYAQGKSRKEIAKQLLIGEETVKFHLRNVFVKLNVENKALAINKAHEIGLIE